MAARYPYSLLLDSPDGLPREAEVTGQTPPMPLPATGGDIKRGFVYKRVPHITLKSIANNEEDEIACRFVDTNYDEESFFARHAYFTGAGDPCGKLKRALRADIDEAAWAKLYSTTSYPVDRPAKVVVTRVSKCRTEGLSAFDALFRHSENLTKRSQRGIDKAQPGATLICA